MTDTQLKDAERYRWLRYGDNDDRVIVRDGDDCWLPRNEELDAVIDHLIEIDRQHGYWL